MLRCEKFKSKITLLLQGLLFLIIEGGNSLFSFFSNGDCDCDCIPCHPCSVRSLFPQRYSISFMTGIFLNAKQTKHNAQLSQFLQVGPVLWHFFDTQPVIYDVALAFAHACTEPKDEPKVDAYGLLRYFMSTDSSLSMSLVP